MRVTQDFLWKRCGLDFSNEVSLTKQAFAAECDINNIIARWQTTGIVEHVNDAKAVYGDFSSVGDYQTALNAVMQAQEAFEALPSKVRTRFANDPSELISFVQDPGNRDEAIQLGLIDVQQPVSGDAGK